MKKLILLNDNTEIKLNDTGTVIQFKASNEGQPVGLSSGQSATFRIKNELGFLKSVTANSSYGGYVFELDTEDLKGLVPDTYQVELLVQVDSDNALIFPDKGFVQFTINANALNITGEQLPVMSLEDFKDELKTYVDNQTTQAKTNIKHDFDTYVDNLTDSTVATATKASQDAQTAINTANTAKSTANSASNIANSMDARITANSTLISSNGQQISDLSNKLLPIYNNQNNLLANPQLTNLNNWYHFNSVSLAGETYNGSEVVKLTHGSGSDYLAQDVKGIDVVNGYTFSVYLKGSTASSLHIDFRAGDKYNINATDEWTQISVSSKFGDQSYTRLYLWNNGTDPIYIASPKLVVWQMTYDMYKQLTGGSQ